MLPCLRQMLAVRLAEVQAHGLPLAEHPILYLAQPLAVEWEPGSAEGKVSRAGRYCILP